MHTQAWNYRSRSSDGAISDSDHSLRGMSTEPRGRALASDDSYWHPRGTRPFGRPDRGNQRSLGRCRVRGHAQHWPLWVPDAAERLSFAVIRHALENCLTCATTASISLSLNRSWKYGIALARRPLATTFLRSLSGRRLPLWR